MWTPPSAPFLTKISPRREVLGHPLIPLGNPFPRDSEASPLEADCRPSLGGSTSSRSEHLTVVRNVLTAVSGLLRPQKTSDDRQKVPDGRLITAEDWKMPPANRLRSVATCLNSFQASKDSCELSEARRQLPGGFFRLSEGRRKRHECHHRHRCVGRAPKCK